MMLLVANITIAMSVTLLVGFVLRKDSFYTVTALLGLSIVVLSSFGYLQ